ncbi:cell division protein ZipA C-terminal FtsZ-binding domain-containing protein [Accumulibacter sp.]|uniref:cell division protein ZipA C-terminal FtsZ-binding domain-containing protein n=1 Tax=Accumulibacter sp. TaxID=2053492 RepID=UPI001A390162|nr:cell division protein ZipA C-terminal FtsZ-binding domain-containing protein [Accumulibacter sp.]MBL8374316.1 cell division protein FtsZ [Accumulibacter sp.]
MTDLQMGLIGLGGVAVIGVLAYNKWQERKHRKLAEELLSARQADVLLDESVADERVEGYPDDGSRALGDSHLPPAAAGAAARVGQERVEPLLREAPVLGELTPDSDAHALGETVHIAHSVPPISAPLCLLSPAIDYIAAIEVSEPAAAYQIRDAQRATLARLGKTVNWIGFNEQLHEWEPILEDGDGAYRHIRVGLQLVDRKGPVRDGDLSIFHVAIQDLATELMGVAELPLREPALQLASQLDEFCAGVDIQIGVNVISQGQVFPGTKLRALAESAGMVIDADGRFARFDDEGNVLFVLLNQETEGFAAASMRSMSTHGVTFLLDVPRVANGDRVLTQMVELGRRFAESLHGALVDDNRRPLSESAIEPIRRQVVQYQTAMAHRQLPAGGALARRLFS